MLDLRFRPDICYLRSKVKKLVSGPQEEKTVALKEKRNIGVISLFFRHIRSGKSSPDTEAEFSDLELNVD